jgi:hypothetical protein
MNEASTDLGMFGTGACECSADYDRPSVYSRTARQARKEHQCCECRATIKKGEVYEYVTLCYDGRWSEYKTCRPCAGIANDLGCRLHEGLYEQFFEIFGWNYLDDPADWDDDDDDNEP